VVGRIDGIDFEPGEIVAFQPGWFRWRCLGSNALPSSIAPPSRTVPAPFKDSRLALARLPSRRTLPRERR